jgi:hypothetical protein
VQCHRAWDAALLRWRWQCCGGSWLADSGGGGVVATSDVPGAAACAGCSACALTCVCSCVCARARWWNPWAVASAPGSAAFFSACDGAAAFAVCFQSDWRLGKDVLKAKNLKIPIYSIVKYTKTLTFQDFSQGPHLASIKESSVSGLVSKPGSASHKSSSPPAPRQAPAIEPTKVQETVILYYKYYDQIVTTNITNLESHYIVFSKCTSGGLHDAQRRKGGTDSTHFGTRAARTPGCARAKGRESRHEKKKILLRLIYSDTIIAKIC